MSLLSIIFIVLLRASASDHALSYARVSTYGLELAAFSFSNSCWVCKQNITHECMAILRIRKGRHAHKVGKRVHKVSQTCKQLMLSRGTASLAVTKEKKSTSQPFG